MDFRRNLAPIAGLSVALVVVTAFATGILLFFLLPDLELRGGHRAGRDHQPARRRGRDLHRTPARTAPATAHRAGGRGTRQRRDGPGAAAVGGRRCGGRSRVTMGGGHGLPLRRRPRDRDRHRRRHRHGVGALQALRPRARHRHQPRRAVRRIHPRRVASAHRASSPSSSPGSTRGTRRRARSRRSRASAIASTGGRSSSSSRTAVFLLIGLEIRTLIEDADPEVFSVEASFGIGLLATVVLIVIRCLWVGPLVWLLRLRERHAERTTYARCWRSTTSARIRAARSGMARLRNRLERDYGRRRGDLEQLRQERIDWRGGIVLGWAGMRGVVTLAAAQSLPVETPYRPSSILIAFTAGLGIHLLQGGTLPWLIRLLGVQGVDARGDRREVAELLEAEQRGHRGLDEWSARASALRTGCVERARQSTFLRTEAAWSASTADATRWMSRTGSSASCGSRSSRRAAEDARAPRPRQPPVAHPRGGAVAARPGGDAPAAPPGRALKWRPPRGLRGSELVAEDLARDAVRRVRGRDARVDRALQDHLLDLVEREAVAPRRASGASRAPRGDRAR